MNTASPATPACPETSACPVTVGRRTPRRGTLAQRPLRLVTLLAATASIAPIAAVANAPQVQAATGHQLAAGAAVTTGSLNLRSAPSARSRIITTLHASTRVTVVGAQRNGYWQQVRVGHTTGYVNDHYLRAATAARTTSSTQATQHAALPVVAGYASIPAARHWSRPMGVTARGDEIAREVHAQFPQIAVMGGYRHEVGSDHNNHRAIDNMLPGNYRLPAQRALGFALADWARANAKRLGITYVIWDQHIWNIARDGEGWRLMADRGSDNQNHKNHVHISFR